MDNFTEVSMDYTTTKGNFSIEDTHVFATGLVWLMMIISILGFVENGVILWFLCFKIRRNPFTVYIANLCVADACLLLCDFVLSVYYTLHSEVYFGIYYTLTFFSFTLLFGYNTGLCFLMVISVERCLCVFYPIWYRCHRSKHQSVIVCTILWIFSCLVTTAEYCVCIDTITEEPIESYREICRGVIIFLCILNFLLCAPLMILSSLILVVKTYKTPLTSHFSKLYIIIVTTVIIFLIFALPLRIMYLLQYQYNSLFSDLTGNLIMLLSTINSAVNPLIYYFVGSSKQNRFRESLKAVFDRAFKDGSEPESHETAVYQRAASELAH
ncbi:proto-oncogene Mas [Alligator mississippiensis]|uniref:proto-oncogene Mas n=1 Tax=Alligator mississippiensis TaxID=8496 RepID=UPI0003D07B2B|nr:proto-oncogene Mas [Alligator mississippiensis]XP_019335444.1 proto-oncogene Mas [Alligator mississippiensis]XP_019335445.1 proto-oncogene Mas [Alligator mississippiensis]